LKIVIIPEKVKFGNSVKAGDRISWFERLSTLYNTCFIYYYNIVAKKEEEMELVLVIILCEL